jgi:hypothetical protein
MKTKIVFFTILSLALAPGLFAQNWLLGGSAEYNFTQRKIMATTADTHSLSLYPFVGYQITEKLDLGASISFELLKQPTNTQKTFGIAPRVRYVLLGGDTFQLLAQGEVFFTYSTDDAPGSKDEKQIGVFVAPVGQINLTERVAVYAMPAYAEYAFGWTDSDNYWSGFNFDVFETLSLGFLIRL